MSAEYCYRNKFGYCKFGEKCRFLHVNELCVNKNCDQRQCSYRHPRECLYFKKYGQCKFGEYCQYEHKKVNNEKEIKKEVEKIKTKCEYIEVEMNALKAEIDKLTKENINLRQNLNALKNIECSENVNESNEKIEDSNSDKNCQDEANDFKCVECDFEGRSLNGLKIHTSTKHKKIVQLDGATDHESESHDGNDSFIYDENIANPQKVKITFIATSKEDAEDNIVNYYLPELSEETFELFYHEDESGETYDGSDHFYIKRRHQKYVFSFMLYGAFSVEFLKSKLLVDRLIDIDTT